jgi:predicted chitinase
MGKLAPKNSNLVQTGPASSQTSFIGRPVALSWTADEGAALTISCDQTFDFGGGASTYSTTGTGQGQQKIITPNVRTIYRFTIRAGSGSDPSLGYSMDVFLTVTNPYPPGISEAAKAGIDALIQAMDDAHFTGEYGRAAVLGIAGGECQFVPQEEGTYYTQDRLLQIFPFLNNHPNLIPTLTGFTGPRATFFSHVYGTTLRGAGFLGNRNDADGGRFYGRGFIQLTGRGNYQQWGDAAHVDIVGNPDLLVSDPHLSAQVSLAYIEGRTHGDPNTQAYVDAAIRAVGINSPDILQTKHNYVNFFQQNGTGQAAPQVNIPTPQ